MLFELLTIIVIAAAIAALARPKPQPIRVRRQPTREELLAQLRREQDEQRTW